MSENEPSNWEILVDRGVQMEFSIEGGTIKVRKLDLDTALRIGYMMTLNLDKLDGGFMYNSENYPFERAEAEVAENIANHRPRVFGETRPADRNCAVRVESCLDDEYELTTDIRNDFECRPELGGGKKLKSCFNETIESLDLQS